jgi:hypothetical protein
MLHTTLANGRWFELSLAEQMSNIGSEVHRMVMAKDKDPSRFDGAVDRALELIDLTLADPRRKKKELARVREVLCDICFGESQYQTTLEDLDDYFFRFSLLPRS